MHLRHSPMRKGQKNFLPKPKQPNLKKFLQELQGDRMKRHKKLQRSKVFRIDWNPEILVKTMKKRKTYFKKYSAHTRSTSPRSNRKELHQSQRSSKMSKIRKIFSVGWSTGNTSLTKNLTCLT